MGVDYGAENVLSFADGELAADLRDRLALATRYLANWYKAVDDSENKAVWYQKIDTLRAKVEGAYQLLLDPANKTFPGNKEVAAYNDASADWAGLWRELTLSGDTIHMELLQQVADFVDMLVQTPALLATTIGNELGKAVGGAAGSFLARAWPYVIGALVVGGVYIFREPLSKLASKAVA